MEHQKHVKSLQDQLAVMQQELQRLKTLEEQQQLIQDSDDMDFRRTPAKLPTKAGGKLLKKMAVSCMFMLAKCEGTNFVSLCIPFGLTNSNYYYFN